MLGTPPTRLACYFCDEYLVGKREDDRVKNCFGYSYGPTENPFLNPRHKQKKSRAQGDPTNLQPFLLKCGHLFHKGCVKKSLQAPNGSYNRTGTCPICKKIFLLGNGIEIQLKIPETKKFLEKQRKERLAAEERRASIQAEIEKLNDHSSRYERGIDLVKETIASDSLQILKDIREVRHRKRMLERFQSERLDPLENILDEINDENVMWKKLLGQDIEVDQDGFVIPTPLPSPPLSACFTDTEEDLPSTSFMPEEPMTSLIDDDFRRPFTLLGPSGDKQPSHRTTSKRRPD